MMRGPLLPGFPTTLFHHTSASAARVFAAPPRYSGARSAYPGALLWPACRTRPVSTHAGVLELVAVSRTAVGVDHLAPLSKEHTMDLRDIGHLHAVRSGLEIGLFLPEQAAKAADLRRSAVRRS